jgi:CRISPR-associated protein Cas6
MSVVDLKFPLRAATVPRDHGYLLYAALCSVLPALHEARWFGVHPIDGVPVDENTLDLRGRARLGLRLPAEHIPEVLALAGTTLDIGGHAAVVGVPNVQALVPAATLDARLVVIKLTEVPRHEHAELGRSTLDVTAIAERYRGEIERQLAALEIARPFELRGRQSLTVGGRRVVGYSVRVQELTAEESLRLQAAGLGGKRRMGCGIFRAPRRRQA